MLTPQEFIRELWKLMKSSNDSPGIDMADVESLFQERDKAIANILACVPISGGKPPRAEVHICTAAHDNKQLEFNRQHHETGKELTKCVYAENCVCMQPEFGTTIPGPLSMFLSPTEEALWEETGEMPSTPGPCLLCIRRDVQVRSAMFTATPGPTRVPFEAPVSNPVNIVGGYKDTVCILPNETNGLGAPIVKHIVCSNTNQSPALFECDPTC